MNCDRSQALLSARADGEQVDVGALDDHLARCRRCRSFDETIYRIRRELRLSTAVTYVDATAAVLAAAGDGRGSDRPGPAPVAGWGAQLTVPEAAVGGPEVVAPGWWGLARRFTAVAAVAAVVATGAFTAGRLSRDPTNPVVVEGVAAGAGGRLPDGEQGSIQPPLLAVWTPGELDPGLRSGLAQVEGVGDVVFVRRATIGLTASHDDQGRPVDVLRPGWQIPLDVAAVDPEPYSRLFQRPSLARLGPGQGLLGQTAARLRGLGPGASLTFGDVDIEVVAVVADELVGAAELLVDGETGQGLGVATVRYAVFDASLPVSDLAPAIDALADEPHRLLVRSGSSVLRSADAVPPLVEMKVRFGEFALRPVAGGFEVDQGWYDANIVTEDLPLIGQVTCHRLVTVALDAALADLRAAGLTEHLPPQFSGCWNPRPIRGGVDLSHHSWGAAVDLGGPAEAVDPEVVAVFERHGFTWGGAWLVPDTGHFEYDPER